MTETSGGDARIDAVLSRLDGVRSPKRRGPYKRKSLVELFVRRVGASIDPDQCLIWSGSLRSDGYGTLGGTTAHRAAYIAFVGDPGKLCVDHLCRNRGCVNVFHLEAVTLAENTRRAYRDWTHCTKGHEFTPENVVYRGRNKRRRCRTCRNEDALRGGRLFLAEARKRCPDCGRPITKRATRCRSCMAVAREADPAIRSLRLAQKWAPDDVRRKVEA